MSLEEETTIHLCQVRDHCFVARMRSHLKDLAEPDFLVGLEGHLDGQVLHRPLNDCSNIIHMLCRTQALISVPI